MQTTLRIDDAIYQRAKSTASSLGISLTRFFEEAVEARLDQLQERPIKKIALPVCSVSGPLMSSGELRHRIELADIEQLS